jgi:hypothetical protein
VSWWGTQQRNHFFGVEPLLEDWNDPEDEWDLIEHIRQHGTLDTDTDGSVLSTGSWYDRNRMFYNPGTWQHDPPKKNQIQSIFEREAETAKREADDAERVRLQRLIAEQSLERSRKGAAAWAKRQDRQAKLTRERQQREAEEQQRRTEEQRQKDAEEHERKRQWAIRTSYVERRITEIVATVDSNSDDRTLMRAMLRYMNLGPGVGQQWDAEKFTRFYCASARGGIVAMARIDVERCYDLLKNRHVAVE